MSAAKEAIARYQAAPIEVRETILATAIKATAEFVWVPNEGPQTEAFFCEADELLYGGEAGGGKSDLLVGLALVAHERSLILRRINKDVADLGDRLCEIRGSSAGYNGSQHVYKERGGRMVQLAGCEQEKDKQRWKGKPHDLKGWDELSDFLESQYVFINGWNRSTSKGQRCRVVAASNPPTTPEGQWITRRWAAWLDPSHPNPAKEGELRWYISVNNADVEVDGPGPHEVPGRRKPVRAMSRTFIRSGLQNNPDLVDTDYEARLDAMPEDIRRAYRDGDFTVGLKDSDFQCLPIAWIEAAMQRWENQIPKDREGKTIGMTAIGLDVAEGGDDLTVGAPRYNGWYAPLQTKLGKECREGSAVAGFVVGFRRNRAPVIIDVGGGYGADAIVSMKDNGIAVHPFNGVLTSTARSVSKQYAFYNKRAEAFWRFREGLDPEQEGGSIICLPNDPILKADLASAHYKVTRLGILIEEKKEIKKRIGRSPDRGDAVVMAWSEGERAVLREARNSRSDGGAPKVNLGHAQMKRG